jgi:hypothetical protein
MQEVNYPTPNCPVELFKLNEVHRQLESPQAFAELVQDCADDFDPSPTQGLQAAVMLVGQLVKYHWDQLQSGELEDYQEELWNEDYQALKKAAALLRQVRGD